LDAEYPLGQYLAPTVKVVDVQISGPEYIKYDYASFTLRSYDQPKGYDATIYINVTGSTVTERDVIIAYWNRDEEIGGARSVNDTSSFLRTKAQCLDVMNMSDWFTLVAFEADFTLDFSKSGGGEGQGGGRMGQKERHWLHPSRNLLLFV
jgi:hypothetical protein